MFSGGIELEHWSQLDKNRQFFLYKQSFFSTQP